MFHGGSVHVLVVTMLLFLTVQAVLFISHVLARDE